MQRNFLAFIISSLFFLSVVNVGCTKVDTTVIGADLIPAVDNVHTFETTLDINTLQSGLFTDTTRVVSTANHLIGNIVGDPLFGNTTAKLYLELKPSFFPFYWGNAGDTINAAGTGVDSVVLCLSYKGLYGDSSAQTLNVYSINNSTTNFSDSSYKLDFQPNGGVGASIGSVTVDRHAASMNQYTYFANRTDSAQNQIRIKLSSTFAAELFSRDSTIASSANGNAFRSDSIFKTFYKGFAIEATSGSGKGLFYVNLADANTRLEVHYRKRNKGVIDTTYETFPFNYTGGVTTVAAHANYINRDRTGSEYNTPSSDALYIQATPGTYATLTIPDLQTFPNSIIHRAEIIVEQIYSGNPLDTVFLAPAYLYIDQVTPSGVGKPVYHDLDPSSTYNPDNSTIGYFLPANGIAFNYFGGFVRSKLDYAGNPIKYYNFNLSRHVQNIVTNHADNNALRLYAPYNLDYYNYSYPFNNSLAYGRIKVGSGTNANYKLRMHIVYSKID